MNFEDQYLVFMKCTGTLDLLSFHENTRTKTCEDCVFSIVLPSTSSVLLLIRKTSLSCWILWLHALVKQVLREKIPYSEFSRSVFSRILPEYGEIRRSPVFLRIQSECGKIRTRRSSNMDAFHIVRLDANSMWIRFTICLKFNWAHCQNEFLWGKFDSVILAFKRPTLRENFWQLKTL